MAEVLLIYPPYNWPRKNPPLGLAYIASYLEQANYTVNILDMSPLNLTIKDLKEELKKETFKTVGISFMTSQVRLALEIAHLIKEMDKEITIFVGGPHASALPEEILREEGIDFVVIGEGEITALELVDSLLKKKNNYYQIEGIAYRQNGRVRINPAREMLGDLDSLPFPAWHLLPLKRYSVSQMGVDVTKPVFALLSSRGCPNNCIFCDSHTIFGRKFRGRSAQNILSEMKFLKEHFLATQFDFVDDLITVNRKRLEDLCDLIIKEKLDIRWMSNARVNTVDYKLLKKMEAAGCERIDFGVESGDERVLKAINKKISLAQIRDAHRWARKAGLKTTTFLMVGNLGEDFSSIKKTIKLVEEIQSDNPGVSIATPFPGTALYQIAKDNNWLCETDWSKYVTSPYILPRYKPVMRTDKMMPDQILNAYYYVNSKFLKRKFQTKYGGWFLLNPYFYFDKMFRVENIKDFFNKLTVAGKLLQRFFKTKTL